MSWEIGTLSGSNVHRSFVQKVKEIAEDAGWVTQRTTSTEWIGKSTGLSTTEEIYLGIKSYESVGSDYYNVLLGVFTGYVSANSFETQPDARLSAVPAHNSSLGYYLTANLQRIVFCLKMGAPVYQHGYMGKFFPYSRPSQYPYPVVCAGMLNGAEAIRYDNTNLLMPYKGVIYGTTWMNFYQRTPAGAWVKPESPVFANRNQTAQGLFGSQHYLQPPESAPPYTYQLEPITLLENGSYGATGTKLNLWGRLDGVYGVTGFGATSENVIQEGGTEVVDQTGLSVSDAVEAIIDVSGKAYVMLQNVYRNGFSDFVALEMS